MPQNNTTEKNALIIAQLRRELELHRGDNDNLKNLFFAMEHSISWKITTPCRLINKQVRRILSLLRKANHYQRAHGVRTFLATSCRRIFNEHNSQSVSHATPYFASTINLSHQFFDVIFIIGCWEGESKRYRVYNLAEGLIKLGYKIHILPYAHISTLEKYNVKASAVVLFRAPYDPSVGIAEFLNYAKIKNIKVVCDTDDLIFDPNILDQIDGFHSLSAIEKTHYIDGIHRYRQLIMASDYVTVPTEYLRTHVEKLGKTARVIPNSINKQQQIVAAEILAKPKNNRTHIRIGYFSGSRTHQADFAQCANTLFQAMLENPNTILRIVGYLDLESYWNAISDRIERMEFHPYLTMLHLLNECDINIAPLDLNSVFCQSKSELKYFEAALLTIPTIASATDPFVRVIENGINGFAVTTPQEWKEALTKLITSSELRKKIGQKAHELALKKFSIQEVTQVARAIYNLTPLTQSSKQNEIESLLLKAETFNPSCLEISWVIPGLIIGGGGHRNILRAAYFLSKFGHKVTLYFTGTTLDPQTLKQQIQEHFYPLDCPIHLFQDAVQPSDVVFATHWSTVNAALTARDSSIDIMYFVQDFEPMFAPMSTEYILAENTYRLGLYHITSGPWCEILLKRDFKAAADHFQFPIDRSIYYPRIRTKTNTNLIFFAKPEMPRRCFELGVMALQNFHYMRPDVEIIMFGSKQAGKQSYDFPVTIRDVLPTLDDLAEMYSNGSVGLVFSTTNPSLIPYEMMACGLPIVDLARDKNEVNYNDRTDIALLADPSPTRMAEMIVELISDPIELAERRKKGLEFVDGFPSEEEMSRRIESLIIARLTSVSSNGEKIQ